MSRRLVRRLKNIGSSPVELKIKCATSNDPFGPTTKELNDIAILTLTPEANNVIMEVILRRIQDNSWRHLLKCLTVIEYVMLVGSMEFVNWLRGRKHLISTLKEYTLQRNEVVSQQIRKKSKTIMKLLNDDKLLNEKRGNFHLFRNQMVSPAVGKRSSLDISSDHYNRDPIDLHIVTDDIPLEFRRGTRSLEIIRNQNNTFDLDTLENSAKPRPHHQEIHRLLADITEE